MRHKQGRKIVEKDVKMKDTVRPRRSTRQSSMKNKGDNAIPHLQSHYDVISVLCEVEANLSQWHLVPK